MFFGTNPVKSTSIVSPLSGLLISSVSPGMKLTVFSCSGLSASLVEIEMKLSSTSMVVMIVASLIDSIVSFGTSAGKESGDCNELGHVNSLTVCIKNFIKSIVVMMF